eukprot:2022130-Amphidinium_carterae.2
MAMGGQLIHSRGLVTAKSHHVQLRIRGNSFINCFVLLTPFQMLWELDSVISRLIVFGDFVSDGQRFGNMEVQSHIVSLYSVEGKGGHW